MKDKRTAITNTLGRVNVDDYITAKKAAAKLSVSIVYLYDLERLHGLVPYYFGGSTFRVYLRAQIEELAAKRIKCGKPKRRQKVAAK
jgi:hypothetical protein